MERQDAWDEMEAQAAEIRRKILKEKLEKLKKREERQKFLAGIQVTNNLSRKEMADHFGLQAAENTDRISPILKLTKTVTVIFNSADQVLKQLSGGN